MLISGARGTGRTALIIYIADNASTHGWVAASVSALPGMLEDIYQRGIEAANSRPVEQRSKLTSISVGPVSAGWAQNDVAYTPNWRTKMNALLSELSEQGLGLLIMVDEVKAS